MENQPGAVVTSKLVVLPTGVVFEIVTVDVGDASQERGVWSRSHAVAPEH
jgi:hypothetical protein